jgi:hypothetical protein
MLIAFVYLFLDIFVNTSINLTKYKVEKLNLAKYFNPAQKKITK